MRYQRSDELCKMMLSLIVLMWLFIAVLMCTGCVHTQYVPVKTVRTDSVYSIATQRDSIIIRDSVVIYQAGDTVYVNKVRDRYRDRVVRDTVERYRDGEVQVPVPVEHQLSWWEQLVLGIGEILIPIVMILLIIIAARVWLKQRGGKMIT